MEHCSEEAIFMEVHKVKRFLSGMLAAIMVLVCLPMQAFATSDIQNNWAKDFITYLNEKQIMFPSGENFKPNAEVSRAEFMRYINRAFQFTETADVSNYTDLDSSAWYYDSVETAVAYGYINGSGANTMNPLGTITRQEVVTILGRLHKYTPEGSDSLTFKDKSSIASWASGYVNEAVKKGYISGYTDGSFKPKNVITRAEMAKILYYFMGNRLDETAEYNSENLSATANNVTITNSLNFKDTTVEGDLYISEGAKGKTVTLDNVVVNGKIIVSGGNVDLKDVTADDLITSTPMGEELKVTCEGNTNVPNVTVSTDTDLEEVDLDDSASGFSDVKVVGSKKPNVTINGDLWSLTIDGKADVSTKDGSFIAALIANAATDMTGNGAVESVEIHSKNVELEMTPDSYTIDSGITAELGGNVVSGSSTVAVTPSSAIFDCYEESDDYANIDITLSVDPSTIEYLTCDSTKWTKGTQYTISSSSSKVTLIKDYLSKLSVGTHTIQFVTEDTGKTTFLLTVEDTSKNSVKETTATFDCYSGSENYQDIVIHLVPAYGNVLTKVTVGGISLTSGTDYTCSSNVLTIKRTSLAAKTTGVYNVVCTFTSGNTAGITLTVVDTSPVNSLSETSIKFDVNTSSSLYRDVVMTLSTVDDATLENVKYGTDDTLLTPVQDYYTLDDGTVTLRKKAIAKMTNSTGTTTVTFLMSKGVNPKLTINYLNTYTVEFNVINDLGTAVNGATVTLTQDDSKIATLTTDSNGYASTALESGTYDYVVNYGNSEAVSGTVKVTSSSVSKNVSIVALNDVNIYVVTESGSKVSDATVTLGSYSATTGSDGVASFEVPSGSYEMTVSKTGYTTTKETVTIITKLTKRVIIS